MKLLKGQRWSWHTNSYLLEIKEDSTEFDPTIQTIEANCTRISNSGCIEGVSPWTFGKGFQMYWIYLEGQDAPQ